MLYKISIAALALTLSGCMAQSGVQGDYTAQQSRCRGVDPANWSWWSPSSWVDDAASNASVKKPQYLDCMNTAGWHVPTPKAPGQVATGPVPNPPSGSPSTNPIASAAVAPVPNPPSGAPSTNPIASAAKVSAPQPVATTGAAPATYQPTRPMATPTTSYGQGAARQF